MLLAYIHNNPVRAGVSANADESSWTSHRFYTGQEQSPSWLDADTGLRLSGFAQTSAGKQDFKQFVGQQVGDGRMRMVEWRTSQLRTAARAKVGTAVELGTPMLDGGHQLRLVAPLHSLTPVVLRSAWEGDPVDILAIVSVHCDVSFSALSSKTRCRTVVAARRLALLIWTQFFGRSASQMAAALQISRSAASQLISCDFVSEEELLDATRLADKIRYAFEQPRNLTT